MAEYVFKVNGITRSTTEDKPLLRYLRDDLNLKSVKDGCSEGACGTCTVLLDGSAWLTVLALSFAPVVVCELRKALNRKKM